MGLTTAKGECWTDCNRHLRRRCGRMDDVFRGDRFLSVPLLGRWSYCVQQMNAILKECYRIIALFLCLCNPWLRVLWGRSHK